MSERAERLGVLREKEHRYEELVSLVVADNIIVRRHLDPLTHEDVTTINYHEACRHINDAQQKQAELLELNAAIVALKDELGLTR